MGGDSFFPSAEMELLLGGQDFPHEPVNSVVPSGDEEALSHKLEIDSVINRESGLKFGEFLDVGPHISSISEAAERQKAKVYTEVLKSYEELRSQIDRLEKAKSTILSYTPGSWAEKAGSMDLSKYDVPCITSLLLIGLKGSGKSSLVNKISRVLEDDIFAPRRAQVSCNSSNGDGTYFLHEYRIPRGSSSFCLYDTRSLSGCSSENLKMLKHWMTTGVRHGELVKRNSDSMALKARLRFKAQRSPSFSPFRGINFVIFVVNGMSLLESMDGSDEKKKDYLEMLATIFNNPLLSFKDDKPVVVVTHGDLLPLSDRVKIRVYLGELLGVPAAGQIFDIPDNDDPATALAIADMLIYCLERADRNLPPKDQFAVKDWFFGEVTPVEWSSRVLIVLATAIITLFWAVYFLSREAETPPPMEVNWYKIRHVW
ncbi:hypothetical protein CDL12_26740 [Handroanthus impetiginosus]|uniref:G domain-containing protein n=1 Tax=Handroanthus impetiginosus TaxID=429701 RepID=A0A2G9G621_9LAMI|nr:hypothetical protein CDL12_26740 [Handroanthus impetiginosus]